MDGTEMSSEVYEYNGDGLIKSMVFKNGDEITHYAYEYCKGCKQSWMSSD
jgi:Pyruvate/2-oxoacid:ferredoxin oxidoreductase delta subunit